MGKRLNGIEKGADDYGGKKKPRQWQRDRKDQRFQEIDDSVDGERNENAPPARNLHVVARMPDKKAAVREPLPPESDEEKLTKLDERIRSEEFNDDERRYIDRIIKDYGKDVYEAKKNIEDGGGVVGDKWIGVFRTSHIEKCKTWGLKRQLAPEKAELIGKYLELKLPVGIPEKKVEIIQSNTEEKKEKSFAPEQLSKLLALIREVRKIQHQIDPKDFQEIIEVIIREDLIAQGIFSEEDFSRAFGHAVKWIEKFNKEK